MVDPASDQRQAARSPWWLDAPLAAVVTAGQLVSIAVVGTDGGGPVPLGAYLVLALTGLPLVARRVHPTATWMIVIGASAVYGLTDWPDPPLFLGGLIALYTVASLAPRRIALTVGAITLVLVVVTWVIDPAPTDLNDLLTPLLAASTAWLAGRTAGTQRQSIRLLQERAERVAQERHDDAERVIAEERLRIARELHDITAHHVSVMAIQAEAGAADPETADRALRAISTSARLALADLRRMLSVLRDTDGPDPRHPQPGLDDLPELIEHVRAGGLEVELHRRGPAADHDGLDLAAFRIVQEALTNVVRHSGASRVDVRVQTSTDGVSVEVVDDGRGSGRGLVEGHGLRGMRERVALYGGELSVEDRRPCGLAVRARLRR